MATCNKCEVKDEKAPKGKQHRRCTGSVLRNEVGDVISKIRPKRDKLPGVQRGEWR